MPIDAEDLALVARPVPGADLGRGGQGLRVVGVAAVTAEVASLIANAQIELAIRTDRQPAG